jgi:type VI secretion system protein ImpK
MSHPDDPFSHDNKTVLRLNPGGRRARLQQQSTPQPQPAPITARPPPERARISGQPNPQEDVWFNPTLLPPGAAGSSRAVSSGIARALLLKRDVPIAPNENVLLEAAGPILLLLGRLRTSLMSANFANLMEQVACAIEEFRNTMGRESIPAAIAEDATYLICATSDDIVQNIPTEERAVWTQYSMSTRFFGERVGGVRFFEKLERAKRDPATNIDLLELFYACLSMGFQGVHRTSPNGPLTLQETQRSLYALLRKVNPRSREDLSPHWRGQNMPVVGSTFQVPFWALTAVAAICLFAIFMLFRILLSGNTQAVATEMSHLFADVPLQIERPQFATPAPPVPVRVSTQLERIRSRLKSEIDQNMVDPVENGQSIIIRVGDFGLFDSAQATVRPAFIPIATKIAAALDEEPGPIRIVGHTDNEGINTPRFTSNFELSVERARAVSILLRGQLRDPSRLTSEGKGQTLPIASNKTIEGRARNRRVEISIPREETLQDRKR